MSTLAKIKKILRLVARAIYLYRLVRREPRPEPEAPPVDRANAARAAREALIVAKAWNPAWEQHGATQLFEQLAGTPALDQLVAILSTVQPAVQFGPAAENEPSGATNQSVLQ